MDVKQHIRENSNNKSAVDSKYSDLRQLSFEEKVVKRYGVKTQTLEHISSIIDIYRINYLNNLQYILEFTGLTLSNYTNTQKSKGIKAAMTNILSHANGAMLGFDMMLFAALSSEFKIPVSLLINYDLRKEGVDLTDYGLRKNSNLNPKYKKKDISFKTESARPLIKNRITRITNAAKDRANNPIRTFNAYALINNSKKVK